MSEVRVGRLGAGEEATAIALFSMMSEVFETPQETLRGAYVSELLLRGDFWLLAAMSGDELVGGLTAHVLPMTRSEASEIFIYDIAVRTDHQRRGIGRSLMSHLCELAKRAGIDVVFVPADDEDTHALDFYRALGGTASPVTFFTFEQGTDG